MRITHLKPQVVPPTVHEMYVKQPPFLHIECLYSNNDIYKQFYKWILLCIVSFPKGSMHQSAVKKKMLNG